MKRKVIMLAALAAIFVLFLLVAVEENQGKPSNSTDGSIKNCGTNEADCHENDLDEDISIRVSPDSDDNHLFTAAILRDGTKLGSDEFVSQGKAVARGGNDPYIHWLDNTDNAGKLDLTNADPEVEDEETFWVGFGYKDDEGKKYINVNSEGYTYSQNNRVPVPKATISIDPDFPVGEETIFVQEGDDEQTLSATIPREGKLHIYFDGNQSTDEDEDDLEYYWDLDADGVFETGDTGHDSDERGPFHKVTYSEEGILELLFRVADGTAESKSITFYLDIKDTESRPELFVDDLAVEYDGSDVSGEEIYQGEEISINAYVKNYDDSDYDKATEEDVLVYFYYAMDSEDYDEWHEFEDSPVNLGLIDRKKQTRGELEWDTEEFTPDTYKVKAVVDAKDQIEEWDEEDNEFQYDGLVEIVLNEEELPPELVLGDLDISPDTIVVNDEVTFDVEIDNIGDGAANNVFARLYIDSSSTKTSAAFNIPAKTKVDLSANRKGAFVWSPSEPGDYDVYIELSYYDSDNTEQKLKTSEETITVYAIDDPNVGPGNQTQTFDDEDDGWFLDAPPVSIVALALVLSAVIYTRKRR